MDKYAYKSSIRTHVYLPPEYKFIIKEHLRFGESNSQFVKKCIDFWINMHATDDVKPATKKDIKDLITEVEQNKK